MSQKRTPRAGRYAATVLRDRWDLLLVIAAGGALGSLGRWALAEAFPHGDAEIAWGTVWANVCGAFALGALMVLVLDVWPASRYARPFIGVGVLGGFTTFSTYMLDTRALLVAGELPLAATYLFGTLLGGLAAVWAGALLARAAVAGVARNHRRRRERRGAASSPADSRPGVDPSSDPSSDPATRSRR